jgi:hypothetical protein
MLCVHGAFVIPGPAPFTVIVISYAIVHRFYARPAPCHLRRSSVAVHWLWCAEVVLSTDPTSIRASVAHPHVHPTLRKSPQCLVQAEGWPTAGFAVPGFSARLARERHILISARSPCLGSALYFRFGGSRVHPISGSTAGPDRQMPLGEGCGMDAAVPIQISKLTGWLSSSMCSPVNSSHPLPPFSLAASSVNRRDPPFVLLSLLSSSPFVFSRSLASSGAKRQAITRLLHFTAAGLGATLEHPLSHWPRPGRSLYPFSAEARWLAVALAVAVALGWWLVVAAARYQWTWQASLLPSHARIPNSSPSAALTLSLLSLSSRPVSALHRPHPKARTTPSAFFRLSTLPFGLAVSLTGHIPPQARTRFPPG